MTSIVAYSYRNPRHNPNDSTYGPKSFTSAGKPIEHAGALIFARDKLGDHLWDVVIDGTCVCMYLSLVGAKKSSENIRTARRLLEKATEASMNDRAEEGVALFHEVLSFCRVHHLTAAMPQTEAWAAYLKASSEAANHLPADLPFGP